MVALFLAAPRVLQTMPTFFYDAEPYNVVNSPQPSFIPRGYTGAYYPHSFPYQYPFLVSTSPLHVHHHHIQQYDPYHQLLPALILQQRRDGSQWPGNTFR